MIGKIKKHRFIQLIFLAVLILFYSHFDWDTKIFDFTNETDFLNGAYKPNSSRFIIFTNECDEITQCIRTHEAYGGLADRFKGITFAYLWALMTNRTFLIYIKKPCGLDYHLNENHLRWHQDLRKTLEKIYNRNKSFTNVELMWSAALYENRQQRDKAFIMNLFEYQKEADIILFKGNFFYQDVFFKVPSHIERLKSMGLDPFKLRPDGIFKHLYFTLFKLSPDLQDQYNIFIKQAKPNKDSKLICAQIRIGDHVFAHNKKFVQNDSTRIFSFIKDKFKSELTQSKIFLTTDSKAVLHEAKQLFSASKLVYVDGDAIHVAHDEANNASCGRNDKTFLDFHILKDCDYGVVSPSGFGRLGVYKSGKIENMYIYLNRKVHQKYHNLSIPTFKQYDHEFMRSNIDLWS